MSNDECNDECHIYGTAMSLIHLGLIHTSQEFLCGYFTYSEDLSFSLQVTSDFDTRPMDISDQLV